MRYLSTLLLTTTFLTTATTYGAAALDNLTQQALPVTVATPTTTTSAVVAAETKNLIDAFRTLVTEESNFNVSDAVAYLFSPELYPYISWHSPKKNEAAIKEVSEAIGDSIKRHTWNPNNKFTGYALLAIIFSDQLEIKKTKGVFKCAEGLENPTTLNELVGMSMLWGSYESVLSEFELTLTPILRLKLLLDLTHQTNITPDSLGHVLTATTELTQMFRTASNKHLLEHVDKFKQSVVDSVTLRDRVCTQLYPSYHWPQINKLTKKMEIDQQLGYLDRHLKYVLEQFEAYLDSSCATTHQRIDRILTSFGSEALAFFREIFERIETHAQTKPNDKIKAAELLIQAGASKEALVRTHEKLANDSNNSVKARLKSAKKLLELKANDKAITAAFVMATDNKCDDTILRFTAAALIMDAGASNDKVVQAYTSILEAVNNDNALSEDNKISLNIRIGIKLHTAGAVELAVRTLSQQFWLVLKILEKNPRKFLFMDTYAVISATEILFNAGKFKNRDSAINFISWAVNHTVTGAFSHETITHGAETAERLGDLGACRKYLDCLKNFKEAKIFQDRVHALEAKLAAVKAE